MNHFNGFFFFRKTFFLLLLSIFCYRFLDLFLLPFIDKHPFVLWKICSSLISPLFHLFLWSGVFIISLVKKTRWMTALFEISVSQYLSASCAQILKNLMGRARPHIFLEKGIYGFYGPSWSDHYHSFPSGHTLTAFILAASLSHLFPKWRVFFYSLATFLSLSRIFLLKHYLSDIIATAAFGVIIVKVVHGMMQKIYTHQNSKFVFFLHQHRDL